MDRSRAVVLGGTGFLGRRIVGRLAGDFTEVRGRSSFRLYAAGRAKNSRRAPEVVLAATHKDTLDHCRLADLKKLALDLAQARAQQAPTVAAGGRRVVTGSG